MLRVLGEGAVRGAALGPNQKSKEEERERFGTGNLDREGSPAF